MNDKNDLDLARAYAESVDNDTRESPDRSSDGAEQLIIMPERVIVQIRTQIAEVEQKILSSTQAINNKQIQVEKLQEEIRERMAEIGSLESQESKPRTESIHRSTDRNPEQFSEEQLIKMEIDLIFDHDGSMQARDPRFARFRELCNQREELKAQIEKEKKSLKSSISSANRSDAMRKAIIQEYAERIATAQSSFIKRYIMGEYNELIAERDSRLSTHRAVYGDGDIYYHRQRMEYKIKEFEDCLRRLEQELQRLMSSIKKSEQEKRELRQKKDELITRNLETEKQIQEEYRELQNLEQFRSQQEAILYNLTNSLLQLNERCASG